MSSYPILRPLSGVPLEELHRVFVEAFSDYPVLMTLPPERFARLLARRGFDPALSLGAFDPDGRLVAFLLNGLGRWQGQTAAYDTGTGVVPAYRRRGLAGGLFRAAMPLLRERGALVYVLEVLQQNEAALGAYRGLGFEVGRALLSFEGRPRAVAARSDVSLRPCRLGRRLDEALAFADHPSSWQNDADSIRRGSAHLAAVGAFHGGVLVGLGVVEPDTGDVAALLVAHGHRRRGLGAALLYALAQRAGAPRLAMINVDEEDVATRGLLHACGFEPTVSQFEMTRRI